MATAKPKSPEYWDKAKRHLSKSDPVLARIIKNYKKGEMLMSRGSAFFSLARAIVGQQISVKAAESVWRKLEARLLPLPLGEADFVSKAKPNVKKSGEGNTPSPNPSPKGGGKSALTPQTILEADVALLRSCGLSVQKVIYMKELAQFFATNGRIQWHKKTDAEVMKDLISIKGIGKWSAEMFLMFHLMRPDVFPVGDLGLRKAIERHYNKGKPMPLPKMQKLAQKWQPYRAVATWYLWRSLDPVAVEY